MMSKKNYIAFAQIMKDLYDTYLGPESCQSTFYLWSDAIKEMCRIFKIDNYKFRRDLFEEACGK